MDNIDDSELRMLKHPRWSPSPVDLSIANAVPPASALIASLGAAYFCSGSPTTANSGYPLNGVMVSGQSSSPHVLNSRKQREFIPEAKKDESYWDRRKRNNEAAKRSREKRRISDMVLEARVLELTRENSVLRAELYAIKEKFGLPQAQAFMDSDSMSMSLSDNQNRGRRTRLLSNIVTGSNHNPELNSSGNSTTSYISSSSSPTSQSSSSSEIAVSTPTMAPNLSSLTYSPPIMSTQSVCCAPNTSPICPIGSVSTATLPFKLRHKAKNNNADSDSDTCANVLTDITPNRCVITENNTNFNNNSNNNNSGNNSVLNDSVLKSENYALRSELQRLATEVASLKNVLVFNPTNNPMKSMSHNDSLHCNSYREDSRPESPNLDSEQNEAINDTNGLNATNRTNGVNPIQSHNKVNNI